MTVPMLRVVESDDQLRGLIESSEAQTTKLPRPRPALASVPSTDRVPPLPPPTSSTDAGPIAPVDVAVAAPAAVASSAPRRAISGRLLALSLLAGTIAVLGWGGVQTYHVLTDAWIAPLHLSPDNDAVANLRLAHQRNLAEVGRLEAEVTRLDGQLAAIANATATLDHLRDDARQTLEWRAEVSRVETHGLGTSVDMMRRQLRALRQLRSRQDGLVDRARRDLAAGMLERSVLDREEQARDQVDVQIAEIQRHIAEARVRRDQTKTALRALRAGTGDGNAPSVGRMPEVAAGDEHAARLDLEIERLHAEARGHEAQRSAAVAAVAAVRDAIAELESRPLYRAMTADTDIAFVPYTQLDKLRERGDVLACTWSVFDCEPVGRVIEILPGEVVTQDPWGELARGQYIVLDLHDASAVRERVLRVR